jgi:DNA helicase HerA-like ATPase
MARILPSDRLLLVSSTGAGKSTLAAYLFSQFRSQRVLVDPKNEWTLRGGASVRGIGTLARELDRAPLVRFVPATGDRAETEALYAELFQRRRLVVWTDEAYAVSEASWCPRGLRLLQTQGRALELGHIVCTQRPRNIARELLTEAEHIFVFRHGLAADDLHAVSLELGLSRDELRAELGRLEPYGFLWFDRRLQHLGACPPLPASYLAIAGRTARKR